MDPRPPVRVPDLIAKKARGEKIVAITAYDFATATYADQAGVDFLLVGDSLGMVVLGYDTTIPVTVEDMLHHVRAVSRARPKALVVGDLPFLSYQISEAEALRNAARYLQEGGANAVKLEGGLAVASTVKRIVDAGIPVMGHLGLTPQSVHAFGGWKVQARRKEQAQRLLEEAQALEAAGAFGIVLELIPVEVAVAVSAGLTIPTIGIGAGVGCDGQVQIIHDLVGLYDPFKPKHAKRYAEVGATIRDAISQYAADVRSGAFPAEEHTFHQKDLEDPTTWMS